MGRPDRQLSQRISLLVAVVGLLLVPLGLRAVNVAVRNPNAVASYIPSVESPRQRSPFDAEAVATLREASNDFILIGDSMARTRIDPAYLSRLNGGRGAAALFHPGSGRRPSSSSSVTRTSPTRCFACTRRPSIASPGARNPCWTRSWRRAPTAPSTGCTGQHGRSINTTRPARDSSRFCSGRPSRGRPGGVRARNCSTPSTMRCSPSRR